ncbi:hypothetical protein BaRGS_00014149 [Batillaria attramentaria]|uniref:Cystatin domain-containing protein n=1 Tax=Batillaria attramentaria TaxID=370345 RepID=A0ABD0L5H3_9CAEN
MMKCGGTSDVKDATEEIQKICDQIRSALEEKAGRAFSSYKAKSYKSQVVAGTNYFVKLDIDDGKEYIHARIFVPLPHTGGNPELHSHQAGKSAEDEIVYF